MLRFIISPGSLCKYGKGSTALRDPKVQQQRHHRQPHLAPSSVHHHRHSLLVTCQSFLGHFKCEIECVTFNCTVTCCKFGIPQDSEMHCTWSSSRRRRSRSWASRRRGTSSSAAGRSPGARRAAASARSAPAGCSGTATSRPRVPTVANRPLPSANFSVK